MTSGGSDIAGRTFGFAFRGFDKSEVRKFLSEVADQHQVLVDRAVSSERQLDDLRKRVQSVEQLLMEADGKYQAAQAHLAKLEADRADGQIQSPAEPELDAVRAFGDKVTEVLQIAVAAGNSIRAEAETWAAQRREEAAQDAENAIASARREVADIVAREESNVGQLRATEEALRVWLQEAHSAIGQVLARPAVGPGELASVIGRIRELGPTSDSMEPDEPLASFVDLDKLSDTESPGVKAATVTASEGERPPTGLLIS